MTSRSVLVVDDDPAAIQILYGALEGTASVRFATSGRDALERMAEAPADLVLLDAHMPGMDGFETCRELTRAHPDVPVLFLTAASDLAHELREQEARVRAALVDKERLVAELRGALEQVKTLSGFLPICMYCKKIRDDQGYWERVESYISARSQAWFSHGLCPDCEQRVYEAEGLGPRDAEPAPAETPAGRVARRDWEHEVALDRVHEQLQRTTAQLQALALAIRRGVVLTSGDEPGFVNAGAARWLGLAPGSVEGPLLAEALQRLLERAEDQDGARALLQAMRRGLGEPGPGVLLRLPEQPRTLRCTLASTSPDGAVWLLDDSGDRAPEAGGEAPA